MRDGAPTPRFRRPEKLGKSRNTRQMANRRGNEAGGCPRPRSTWLWIWGNSMVSFTMITPTGLGEVERRLWAEENRLPFGRGPLPSTSITVPVADPNWSGEMAEESGSHECSPRGSSLRHDTLWLVDADLTYGFPMNWMRPQISPKVRMTRVTSIHPLSKTLFQTISSQYR